MCGVTGIWQTDGAALDVLESAIQSMTGALVHRGPDDSGVFLDAPVGLALGFRRLSIIDLSPTGHQPMTSADGRYTVVFNGEVYNFAELREELQRRSHPFRGTSDTEVILEAFAEWGVEETLPRLIGMFAIALWDRQDRALTLIRDRLGIKPLYYAWSDATLLFASELKAFRRFPGFDATLDPDALALFLRFGYVPSPWSIYRGARKMPPGHYGVFKAGVAPRIRSYWSAADAATRGEAEPLTMTAEEATDALEDLLRDAVARRLVADVPLGAFLSGGIDSSAVVALMCAANSRVKTFSIGLDSGGYNEAPYARAVAEHLGTDHTEFYVTPADAQAVIPKLPDIYDEPFADSSQLPTFLVSQLARTHVTVALSGDGGDEVFGGYNRHVWLDWLWRRAEALPRGVRSRVAAAIRRVPESSWDRVYGALEPTIPRPLRVRLPGDKAHKIAGVLDARNPAEAYMALVSQWQDPPAIVQNRHAEPLVAAEQPASVTKRLMLLDQNTYLPDDILAKVDRASMAVSLEVRVPLLDHRIVEWAWRAPFELHHRDGRGKWLLRQVLYRYVPRELIERPKAGFGIPLGEWLRGPLRAWAEEMLSPDRLADGGWLNAAPIRAAWNEHLGGRRDWQRRLWTVIVFQAWRERWSHATP